jgi:hypothetical protein
MFFNHEIAHSTTYGLQTKRLPHEFQYKSLKQHHFFSVAAQLVKSSCQDSAMTHHNHCEQLVIAYLPSSSPYCLKLLKIPTWADLVCVQLLPVFSLVLASSDYLLSHYHHQQHAPSGNTRGILVPIAAYKHLLLFRSMQLRVITCWQTHTQKKKKPISAP